jgi:hypothetical protein
VPRTRPIDADAFHDAAFHPLDAGIHPLDPGIHPYEVLLQVFDVGVYPVKVLFQFGVHVIYVQINHAA